MKKSNIISELFSILKNMSEEDRFFSVLKMAHNNYVYDVDFLNNAPKDVILDSLEKIITIITNYKGVDLSEEELLYLIKDFCEKLSNVDFKTFKKELIKDQFNLFKTKIKDNKKIIGGISALVLFMVISWNLYKQIDKDNNLDNINTQTLGVSMVAINEPKNDLPNDIKPVLKDIHYADKKEELNALEERKDFENGPVRIVNSLKEIDLPKEDENEQQEDNVETKEPIELPALKKPIQENIEGEYAIPESHTDQKEQSLFDEIVAYIMDKYNITLEQFNVIKAVVIAEAKWDSFVDGYAVINTIYNRTQSEKWLYTAEWCYKDANGNRLKLDGTNIYDVVISPYQFEVYGNGRYLKYLDKNDGPVVDAIIAFYDDLRNGRFDNMHEFLNFKSSETEMDCYYEQLAGQGGNKYHGRIDDRIVTEENTKGLS